MKRSSWHDLRNDTTGAMAAVYALALPVLVAVAGIGFDYARIASMDTELQNAADQAALAGATQLDGKPDSIARATSAAQGGLVTNSTLFANDGGATAVDVPSTNVFFYETVEDAEAATSPIDPDEEGAGEKAHFIRVVVETRTANYALTPVVGALNGSLDAEAVAGIGGAVCRTPPLMICNPSEENAIPDDPAGGLAVFDGEANRGRGMVVKKGGGNAWSPGNFGYLDVGLSNGATGVKEALGWDSYPGTCQATFGGVVTVDTQTGDIASAPDLMNTRFDMYDAGCETDGSCPASINSRKDVVRSATASGNNACKYSNNTSGQGWYLPTNFYQAPSKDTPMTQAQRSAVNAMGHPRDMCHAVSLDGSCSGDGIVGDGNWDRDAYFYVNYVRSDNTHWTHADWVANVGKGSTPTRFQVYEWEAQNAGNLVDGVRVLNPRTLASGAISHGSPVCSQIQGFGSGSNPATGADRRRMSVAVVNCMTNNVSGSKSGVPVANWIDVFLVEPSLDRGTGSNQRTRKDEIYVEIIGNIDPGADGDVAGAVIRRDVPYLVR